LQLTPAKLASSALASHVTIVTSISSYGILRQHAIGKNSPAERIWEKSMHFKNQLHLKSQLSRGPSLRRLGTGDDEQAMLVVANSGAMRAELSKAQRRGPRPHIELVDRPEAGDLSASRDATMQSSSGRAASWCLIPARRFVAVIEAMGGFAVRIHAALASAMLAVMSWAVAQILSGCAEYCQAMYPTFPDEPVEASERAADRLRRSETAACGTAMPFLQSRFDATATIDAQALDWRAIHVHDLTRLEVTRSISSGRKASIASPVAEFWLGPRRERGTRRTMMALRAFDDWAERDVRMSHLSDES
jgi:hypothetical protein